MSDRPDLIVKRAGDSQEKVHSSSPSENLNLIRLARLESVGVSRGDITRSGLYPSLPNLQLDSTDLRSQLNSSDFPAKPIDASIHIGQAQRLESKLLQGLQTNLNQADDSGADNYSEASRNKDAIRQIRSHYVKAYAATRSNELTGRDNEGSFSSKEVIKLFEEFEERLNPEKTTGLLSQYQESMNTLPFQLWLNNLSASVSTRQLEPDQENPFSAHAKAIKGLQSIPTPTSHIEKAFRQAIEDADQIDPAALKAKLYQIQATKTGATLHGDQEAVSRCNDEMKSVALYQLSPGLLRAAHAVHLDNTGNRLEAAENLLTVALDYPEAAKFINSNDNTFEKLLNHALNGERDPVEAARSTAEHLENYRKLLQEVPKYLSSGETDKAKEALQAAGQEAQRACLQAEQIDHGRMAENAEFFRKQFEAERSKPHGDIDPRKIELFLQNTKRYEELSHIESHAQLALATVELPLSHDTYGVRKRIERIEANDPTISEQPGMDSRIRELKDLSREKRWSEQALDALKNNAGSIVAIGSGFIAGTAVAGLTCWSGPGAGFAGFAAGAATSGAVATLLGSGTDYVLGNEVTLKSSGLHFLEGASGGTIGLFEKGTALALEANAARSAVLSAEGGLEASGATVLTSAGKNTLADFLSQQLQSLPVRGLSPGGQELTYKILGSGVASAEQSIPKLINGDPQGYLQDVASGTLTSYLSRLPFKTATASGAFRNLVPPINPGGLAMSSGLMAGRNAFGLLNDSDSPPLNSPEFSRTLLRDTGYDLLRSYTTYGLGRQLGLPKLSYSNPATTSTISSFFTPKEKLFAW
jgi:hypothetical protein